MTLYRDFILFFFKKEPFLNQTLKKQPTHHRGLYKNYKNSRRQDLSHFVELEGKDRLVDTLLRL